MFRVLVLTAHRTIVEPYAEASTLKEALEIKDKINLGFFFAIDYVGEDGIPHLVKENGGFIS